MRCCVPFCKNTSDNVSTSGAEGKGISFHGFPSEVHLRAAWLRALGKDSHLPDSAVVCSQHFLSDDIYEIQSGRQIVSGAIPTTVQVCMICLDTDSKMFPMSKHRLEEAYEKLTGHPLCDPGNLKQTLCVQCAQRLKNFSRFRDKSLRARALMMDLVDKHELITRRHIKTINRTKHQLKSNMVLTTLGPDHCDLHILEHSSEDKQTDLEETGHRVVVKTEGSDDSMSVDEHMGVINEEDNNVDDFVQDALNYESTPFQCTLCSGEFVHENAYIQHMCMHLQDGDGDGECDTSQVCKPHTAVSSSSSLITENKQPDPSPAAHVAHALVAPLPVSLTTNNQLKVLPTEEDDTNDSCRYKTLTDCFVKLYDVFTKKSVQRQDGSLMKTRKAVRCCDSHNIASKDISHQPTRQNEVPATEYNEPVTSGSSSSGVKVIVSKILNSKTDCLYKVIDIQYDNTSQNSSYTVQNSFTCDICRNMYKRKSLLIKHIKTHTAVKRFTCNICQYKSYCKRALRTHMRTHTGVKPFSCELCEFKSARSPDLTRHMSTHSGKKPYACEICNNKFTQNGSLVSHMRTHTGEKPYTCEICNNKFTSKSSLVSHMRTHTGEKPYTCEICNNKFTQNGTLVSHMRTHTGEKPYTCEICNNKFTSKSILVLHMRTHTGEKPYTCEICNNKFTSKSSLVSHMRTHTGEKPYTCEICNNKFTFKSILVLHMRTHTGEKPYTCEICNNKFTSKSSLVSHTRTHTGIKPYTCEICNNKFTSKSNLVTHMRTHTCEKPYTCEICNNKFTSKSSLVSHTRTHTGVKPYTCEICNNKFTFKCNLVTHMRTHTGEKPFTCEICNNKFTKNSSLVIHMRTHTGEKPFTCEICNNKFTNNSSLVLHMRTHTGEKPYTCKICNNKFTGKSNLVTHMRTHTGEKPYSCTICEYNCAYKSSLVSHMRNHTGDKPSPCS